MKAGGGGSSAVPSVASKVVDDELKFTQAQRDLAKQRYLGSVSFNSLELEKELRANRILSQENILQRMGAISKLNSTELLDLADQITRKVS